jgi:uncharacterized protein (TIGR03083 family)
MTSFDRHCAEMVAQTSLLRSCIKGADLTVPVPSCPGWNVGQLLRHLGGAQRGAEEVVRTRATGPVPDSSYRDLSSYTYEDPDVVGPRLTSGAERLASTLRAAGPDAPVWTPVPAGTARFYARRFTHETAVHRADATLALGFSYTLDEEVAADAIDEWMELGSLPMHFEIHPWMRELLGPGRTRRPSPRRCGSWRPRRSLARGSRGQGRPERGWQDSVVGCAVPMPRPATRPARYGWHHLRRRPMRCSLR